MAATRPSKSFWWSGVECFFCTSQWRTRGWKSDECVFQSKSESCILMGMQRGGPQKMSFFFFVILKRSTRRPSNKTRVSVASPAGDKTTCPTEFETSHWLISELYFSSARICTLPVRFNFWQLYNEIFGFDSLWPVQPDWKDHGPQLKCQSTHTSREGWPASSEQFQEPDQFSDTPPPSAGMPGIPNEPWSHSGGNRELGRNETRLCLKETGRQGLVPRKAGRLHLWQGSSYLVPCWTENASSLPEITPSQRGSASQDSRPRSHASMTELKLSQIKPAQCVVAFWGRLTCRRIVVKQRTSKRCKSASCSQRKCDTTTTVRAAPLSRRRRIVSACPAKYTGTHYFHLKHTASPLSIFPLLSRRKISGGGIQDWE